MKLNSPRNGYLTTKFTCTFFYDVGSSQLPLSIFSLDDNFSGQFYCNDINNKAKLFYTILSNKIKDFHSSYKYSIWNYRLQSTATKAN